MQSTFSRFILLARRWWWLVALGVILCGGTTYAISKKIHPIYRASATLIVNFQTSPSSYDNTTAGMQAVPTYAQLLTSPTLLNSVLAHYQKGMTLQQLTPMVSVVPKPNSQIIELDVDNTDPTLAMNLANEISNQFVQYANAQLNASVVPVYAVLPTSPERPKPLQDAGIAALAGLGLALALIFLFEWIDDRPRTPEEVQDIFGLDVLAVFPRLSRRERSKSSEEIPALAEGCRMMSAGVNSAHAIKPFKGIMVTSALAGEGKTATAINLATFLAMAGKRVLLLDADLRRPVLHHQFHLDNHHGLMSALMDSWMDLELDLNDQPTDVPMLRVVTAGTIPSNPAEVLQSSQAHKLFNFFQKMPEFDYVIFDTPPLLPVADAQILASYIQTVVLVVDVSQTTRKSLLRARRVLNKTRATVLGVVINKSHWPDDGEIRQYLNKMRRPKVSIDMARPPMPPHTPPVENGDIVGITGSSRVNDWQDPGITIPYPHQHKDKHEES